ncbi:transcription initiation factor TFIID subunit 13 [Monosporozyma unispora]|nr:Transcription initiation factor TFIID subunit 13 [Kazachstania unispora]
MSRKLKRSNLFSKDLNSLLYSYGDSAQPNQQTTHCLDELVSAYLVDICTTALKTAQNSQRNKVKLDDFKFALKNDPIKLARAEELISTNKLITEAKKQFSETDNQSLKRFRTNNDNEEEVDEENENESDDDKTTTTLKPTKQSNKNKKQKS